MRFRCLAVLMLAVGLISSAELLAQSSEGLSRESQARESQPLENQPRESRADDGQDAEEQGNEQEGEFSSSVTPPGQQAQTPDAGAAADDLPESTFGTALESNKGADEVIQETERQFEAAQRELEQRFREVEQESPVEPSAESQDIEDILRPSSDPKVRAALEETERRFEEASRQIESSFKEAERDVPEEVREARSSAREQKEK
ncbi:hypothetical protein [Halomonas halocynthiae]|uniref:hypothetical protein n=1 Tax=Halomonas halocynthiae TaxID=176290 RepID=UPI000425D9EA|nr:hypothetical protein [Halomonas halocynthiae]